MIALTGLYVDEDPNTYCQHKPQTAKEGSMNSPYLRVDKFTGLPQKSVQVFEWSLFPLLGGEATGMLSSKVYGLWVFGQK